MKILLLGSGGREHALAWKIAQSAKCEKLFIAPGNAGTGEVGENVAIKADDFEAIKAFVVGKKHVGEGIMVVDISPHPLREVIIYFWVFEFEVIENLPIAFPELAEGILVDVDI